MSGLTALLTEAVKRSENEVVKCKCDSLKENPALCANIEFEFEAILSVEVISQLNSDYCTNVSQRACTPSC